MQEDSRRGVLFTNYTGALPAISVCSSSVRLNTLQRYQSRPDYDQTRTVEANFKNTRTFVVILNK